MKRYDLVIHKDKGAVEERDAGEFVKYKDCEELIEGTLKVCEESISNRNSYKVSTLKYSDNERKLAL